MSHGPWEGFGGWGQLVSDLGMKSRPDLSSSDLNPSGDGGVMSCTADPGVLSL